MSSRNMGAKKSRLPSGTGTNSRRAPNNPGGVETNKPTAHRLSPFLIALGFCLFASLAHAQRSPKKHNQPPEQPPVYETPKNQDDLSGRFTFARIRFDVGAYWAGMPLGDNGPPWSHDYPDAGRHLMQIMAELSKLDVTLGQNEVIYAFGDPELFKYPFAYLCEVGYMNLSEKELAGMREYWQWSGNPFYPIDTTNEAYKFGVNYIIYALTH